MVCEIYPDETSEFLGVARHHAGGDEADQHHGLSAAGRGLCGERRNDGQLGALAAVEVGRAAHRRAMPSWIRKFWPRSSSKFASSIKKEGGKFPDAIMNLAWTYTTPNSPSLAEIAKEINGKALADMHDDKQTHTRSRRDSSCLALPGCATMARRHRATGSIAARGRKPERMMQRRGTGRSVRPGHLSELGVVVAGESPRALQPRFLRSERASPGIPRRKQVWWNEAAQKWVGNDVPDFKADSNPKEHMGPFIMNPEGVGRLFVPLARHGRRPVPRALRTDREPDRESAASRPDEQSGREEVQDRHGQIRHAGRGLQHRLHHLPADRALPLLDEEQSR